MKKWMKLHSILSLIILSIVGQNSHIFASDDINEHLVLDVSFEDTIKDNSPYNTPATVVGEVRYVEGINGKAVHIVNGDVGSKDKTDAIQYIDFGKPDNLKFGTEDYSISFWLKSKTSAGDGAALISNKDFYTGSNTGFTVGLFSDGLRFNFTPAGAKRTDINPVASASVMQEGWHHYVFTIKRGDKIIVYRDGKETNTKDIQGLDTTIDTDYNFVLGASGVFQNGVVDAQFDELKVYKIGLSLDNAKTLYIDGLVHQAVSNGKKTYDLYKDKPGIKAGLLETLKVSINTLEEFVEQTRDITKYDEIMACINSLNGVVKEINESISELPEDGLVLHLDFEDTVNDISGYNHHGTIVNTGDGSITYEGGAVGKGIHIQSPNGSKESNIGGDATEYIKLPESDKLKFSDKSFSIALWTKFPSVPKGDANALISNKNWFSGSNKGFTLGAFSNGLTANITAETGGRFDTSRKSIFDQKWHFVVVNVDRENAVLTMYIDNELQEGKDISKMGGPIDVDHLHWVIGASGTFSNGVSDVYLDEIRFYNRNLTSTEQTNLYQQFSKNNELGEALETAKQHVMNQELLHQTTTKRVAEAKAGFAYIEEEIAGADDMKIARLARDLDNIMDRFGQEGDPILSFNTITDTHIDRGKGEALNFDNYLKDIRWLNPDSKVIMNSGDFTDAGKISEYQTYYRALSENAIVGRKYLTALGNHDVRWLCSTRNPESSEDRKVGTCYPTDKDANLWRTRYLEYNQEYMGDDWDGQSVYHKQWIGEYLFLVLNTEKDLKDWAYISQNQLDWLDQSLSETDPNKPVFIALHQILGGTAYYEEGDLVGEQDEQLKEVLRKYPHAVLFTGHVHSTVDRANLYHGDWGHMMDMASYSYAYTAGADKRNQISYQVDVYEDKVIIRVRDHTSGEWLNEYQKEFWITDPIPRDANDDRYDIDTDLITPTAGTEQPGEPVTNLFDGDESTIWHSKWSGEGTTRDQTWINMHLEELTKVDGFRYKPRQNGGNGTIIDYEVYISSDNGKTYMKHASGTFPTGSTNWLLSEFDEVQVTDIKIQILTNVGGGIYGSGAELRLLKSRTAELEAELESLLNEAEQKIENYYSTESYKELKKAMDAVRTVLDNPTVSSLETAIREIQDKIDALVLIPITNLEDSYSIMLGESITLSPQPAGGNLVDSLGKIDIASFGDDYVITPRVIGEITLTYKALHGLEKNIVILVTPNTRKLSEKIIELEELDVSKYTPDSVKTLTNKISEAKKVLASATTQEAVDTIFQTLEDTFDTLQLKADITKLRNLIDVVIKYKEKDYEEKTYHVFQEQLSKAQLLILNENIHQNEIDEMLAQLLITKEALVKQDSYTILMDLLFQAKTYQATDYTKTSFEKLETAIKRTETLLNDLGTDLAITEEKIVVITKELAEAIKDLEKIKHPITPGNETTKPEDVNKVNTVSSNIRTGDSTNTQFLCVLIGLSMITVWLMIQRRKEQ